MIVSPPQASGTRPCSESCCITRVGSAFGPVDLVDGDDYRHLGRLGVIYRLDGLWHDPVVCCDDEHDDVGDESSPGAHRGERLVTGRVDEGDRAARSTRPGTRRCAG